jgi:hypothetical protein
VCKTPSTQPTPYRLKDVIIVAVQAQKERNVLKHQSTLLMADVIGDGKMMRLLQELEVLKRALEEEQQRHMMELQELQVFGGGGSEC